MVTGRLFIPFVKGFLVAAVLAAGIFFSAAPTAADPSFGVGPGSPSGLAPGTIFNPAPGQPKVGPLPLPTAVISETALGLSAGDTVDDISFGDDPFPQLTPYFALFSVAPGSTGHPAAPPVSPVHPDINQELSAVGDGSVSGDVYYSFNVTGSGGPGGAFAPGPMPVPCGPIDGNVQAADENGVGPWALGVPNVGLGLTPGDRLNKLEIDDHSTVDFIPAGGDGKPDKPVFFTVDTVTAAALPPLPPFFGVTSAADVLAWDPSTSVLYDWAPAGLLGLAPAGDDIDALKVGYVSGAPISAGWIGAPDTVVFSLKPGSASLPALGSICYGPGTGTPGDVYEARGPFAGPEPIIDAEMLGLNTLRSGGTGDDDLAAIDFAPDTALDTDGDGYPDFQELTMGKNPLTYCAMMRADVNMDGKVNLLDLGAVASWFGQMVPPAPARYDQGPPPVGMLPRDNKINLLDLGAMAGVFGQPVMNCQ